MKDRMTVLQEMQQITRTWDGSATSAQEIIGLLKPLVELLATMETIPYTQEEELLMQAAIAKQLEMIAVLKTEKAAIATEMRAINKKASVIENYLYPKNQPTFVNHQL